MNIIYDEVSGIGKISAWSDGTLNLTIGPLSLPLCRETAKRLVAALEKLSDPNCAKLKITVKNGDVEVMRFEKRECGLFFYIGAAIGFLEEKQSTRVADKLKAAMVALDNNCAKSKKVAA